MGFATVADLKARWPTMPDDLSLDIVEAKIEDAGLWLTAQYPTIPENPQGNLAGVLRMIVCNMVRRSFSNQDYEGLSKYSESAGVFSETLSFYSGGDNLYLTKQEIALLESAIFGTTQDAGSYEIRGM